MWEVFVSFYVLCWKNLEGGFEVGRLVLVGIVCWLSWNRI